MSRTTNKRSRFAIHKYVDGKLVTVASGVRNCVGFDWHPKTNKLYFSDNGRDWLGDNSPSCELNVIEEDGAFMGIHTNMLKMLLIQSLEN